MHTNSPSSLSPRRALVLGGGGSAGNAWLIGVATGLADGGLDVTAADLIIGTSAGSTAAAQITSAPLAELLEATVAPPPPSPRPTGVAPHGGAAPNHMERTARIIAESADALDMRRRMGAAAIALAAASDAPHERWRRMVAPRLPRPDWPAQRIVITAVDAETGEEALFDRDSGVELVDAVAASCSSGFAYPIGGRWFIDGGYRSNADNADLGAGCERVLVLSPFGGETRTPPEWGLHLSTQIERLRAEGSRVETIFPDAAARAAYGDDVMAASTRAPAARAGYAHGLRAASDLIAFWR